MICLSMIWVTTAATAADAVDVMWDDLQPPRSGPLRPPPDPHEPKMSLPDPSNPLGAANPANATVSALNGKRVRIPAYVVPLDGDNDSLSEMLLVPYFGACIHVPPPPPNQIIYINSDSALDISKLDLYDPVWATGVLKTEALEHELADVGYRMEIEKLTKYNPRARNK